MKPDDDPAAKPWRDYSAARLARAKAEVAQLEARARADAADRAYETACTKCDAAAAAWRAAIEQPYKTTDPDSAVLAGNPKED